MVYVKNELDIFKNINSRRANKVGKEFPKLFKENRLYLEIECNLKTVNYLDITLETRKLINHMVKLMMKHVISTQNPCKYPQTTKPKLD